MNTPTFNFFNGVIDVLFGIDFTINFRTSYIDQHTGDEICDNMMIAKNYVKGHF